MITNVKPPVGPVAWPDLQDELDRWRQCGRCATLWWRDDDAVAPSRRLDDLLGIAGDTPVALAVIPGLAEPELAARLEAGSAAAVRVLQHGWRHLNHASDRAKSEFPRSRPQGEIAAELACGRERLKRLFGARALSVLAPPWNRIDPTLLPLAAAAGLGAVSQIKARHAAWPAAAVFAANVHVDLVAWQGGRGFVGEDEALRRLLGHLRSRRERRVDPDEPTGVLSHHLVQDAATDAFLGRLLGATRGHGAARWLGAEEVFAPGIGAAVAAGRA